MPEVALHWEKHFQWALGKYNRTHEEQMPKITLMYVGIHIVPIWRKLE